MRAVAGLLVALSLVASVHEARSEPVQPSGVAPLSEICGMQIPQPARLPPDGSPPIVLAVVLCFDAQGGTSSVVPETYLYYLRVKPSEPSRGVWVPYDEETERLVRGDFRRLWDTGFLDDLMVEVRDHVFPNGTIGKLIVFHLEERQRIRIVVYEGVERISQADIVERLKSKAIDLRLDGFVDPLTLRRAAAAIRELYAEKGHPAADVAPRVEPMPQASKLARVIFRISEGPRIAVRDVEFTGNRVFSDRELSRALRANRPQSLLSLVSDRGTYHEDRLAEDAQSIVDFYRDRGYVTARVEQPTLRVLDDSPDGRTRWVQLRLNVSEGPQYRVGNVTFEGNTVVRSEALEQLFRIAPGDLYRQSRVTRGLERARELYGAGGYFEFVAYPDVTPRPGSRPVVDLTVRVTEGPRYFVNRLTFTGNTQTRDQVIRREMALVEGGIFNTEALKHSIRRINQLGYFKPIEDKAISVTRPTGTSDRVDVAIAVEEQNRHQLTFGAGLSQYDGVFANVAYTTSNFLGRGETATVSIQSGARADSYQVGFSEPYLFGRAITAGTSLYSRKADYTLNAATVDYSEVRSGFTLTSGVPIRRFTRLFATYGYERVDTAMTDDLAAALQEGTPPVLASLQEGRFTTSSITPSLVHDTVDNPFAPRSGRRLTMSAQYAGGVLGGTSAFVKPEIEAIQYLPLSPRTALGVRVSVGRLWNLGSRALPYYQRYFLGGETQIRGVDIRSVGPLSENGVPLGGTAFVLFNAEYYYDLFPRVRMLAFHDAGQAFGEDEAIDLRHLRTSTGVELRVTLPMLNVPFRLIQAWNLSRDAFQPARAFKVSVGTTF